MVTPGSSAGSAPRVVPARTRASVSNALRQRPEWERGMETPAALVIRTAIYLLVAREASASWDARCGEAGRHTVLSVHGHTMESCSGSGSGFDIGALTTEER